MKLAEDILALILNAIYPWFHVIEKKFFSCFGLFYTFDIALTSLRFLLHLSRCVTVKSKSNINLDLTFNLVLKIKHENTWKFWFDIKKNKDILVMSTSAFTPLYPLQSWLWQFRETREQIKQTQMGREES